MSAIVTLPPMRRVLFVCTENYCRSPTAEVLFKGMPGVWARSAGISDTATVRMSQALAAWADMVICFEETHKTALLNDYGCESINVNIPDEYAFMDPELCDLIRASCARYISEAQHDD